MNNITKLISCILGCQLVGILGTPFTISAIPTWYATLNKPFFSPPNWIFAPVWTLLYLLMGVSLYLIWTHRGKKKQTREAIMYFLAQLACNFLWTPVFFGLKSPFLALIVIIIMWILIVFTIKRFYALSKTAGYLLIPYLSWVSFATMLNAAILLLN